MQENKCNKCDERVYNFMTPKQVVQQAINILERTENMVELNKKGFESCLNVKKTS